MTIGFQVTYNNGNSETFNPEISESISVLDIVSMKGAISLSSQGIAVQLNNWLDTLDHANITSIVLNLNSNSITYQPVVEPPVEEPAPEETPPE